MDKQKLAELLLEKQRRTAARKPTYTPNAGQLPIHMSTAHDRWVLSGNGAGKSCALVHEIYAAGIGKNPWTGQRTKAPCKMILVVDQSRKAEEVILPELRKWFDIPEDWLFKEGKPYISKIKFPNGSTLSVYSTESDPTSFEGVMADYVFCDEPLPYLLYVALKRSLRIKDSPAKFLFCGTPVSQPWIKSMIYDPWCKNELADLDCFRVGTSVNEQNLDKGYIDRFSATLTEAEKRTRLDGEFFHAEGMALAHLWDASRHVIPSIGFEWNMSWPVAIAIDPHPVKKHVAVMVGVDPDQNLFVLKETALKAPASQFAEHFKHWSAGYKVLDTVVDSLGSTDGTSFEGYESFIDVMNQCGVRCRATRYEDKSHEDFIDRMQTGLVLPESGVPKLRVLSTCKGVIGDITSVGWQRDRRTGSYAAKLATGTKDYLSALGYALATNLTFDKPAKSRPHVLNRAPYRGLTTPTQRMVKYKTGRLLPKGFRK